jgi:ferrous iron transport protein B
MYMANQSGSQSLPQNNGKSKNQQNTLSNLPSGKSGFVCHLEGEKEFINRITSLGFAIGAQVTVLRNQGQGPMIVSIQGAHIALGRNETDLIQVQAIIDEQNSTLTIALAGQPNVGKSTIYNLLTGESQYVSNWPGKTSECQAGYFNFQGEMIRLVDLPGAYSLSSSTEEERIAREFIIENHPDVLLVILDAASLERNLYLVAELLGLSVPLVLAINRMDLAAAQGIHIEPKVLEAAIRVPVVPLIAQRGEGIQEAIAIAIQTAHEPDACQPNRPVIRQDHQEVLQKLEQMIRLQVPAPYPSDWVAMKLLEGDRIVTDTIKERLGKDWEQVHALLIQHDDAFLAVASGRYDWIERMVRAAVIRPKSGQLTVTDRIDHFTTHPVWGILILIAVMAGLFGLTFSLGIPLQEWLEKWVVQASAEGVTALMVESPPWLVGLITKGIISGVGTVLTLLPILILFFICMGILEDLGYMARAAFVMDNLMHPLGLHGKSFLPFSLGIGCNVPAVMESRIIEEPKARLITILLTPLIPCFPRLSVVALLAPIFFGRRAFEFSLLVFSFPLLFLVIYGRVFHELFQGGKHNAFIMELPLYQSPHLKAILKSVGQRIVDFLKGAGSIILFVSIGLWALSYFPGEEINSSYLAQLGHILDPLSNFIGLDWRLAVALITSMLRSENTITTLAVLYGAGQHQFSLSDALSGQLVPAAGLAFLAMQVLFVPCIATVAAIHNESKSWLSSLGYVGLRLATSIGVGVMIYQGCKLLHWGV